MDPSTLGPLNSSSSPVALNQATETASQLPSGLNHLVQVVSGSHFSNDATSSAASLSTENVNRTIYRIPKESMMYYYCVYHPTRSGKESHYYKLAFPIFRTPNKCYLRAQLEVETSEPRPSNEQLVATIKNAIEVYKRVVGQEELVKEIRSTIFTHKTRDPLKIDLIGDITPFETGYRVPFQVECTFGVRSKTNKTLWTVKLFNIPLLEDVLTEKETSKRDKRIAGTQPFEPWEQQAEWYPQYKKALEEKSPIATRMSLEDAVLPNDKSDEEENLSYPEEQGKTHQQPTHPLTRKRKSSTKEPSAKRSTSGASSSASPTRDSSDQLSLSSTAKKVKQVGQLATQVLQFLETVEDKDRQITQLKQELQKAENKNKELLDAWEKESHDLHQQLDQSNANAQSAQKALNHFKEMGRQLFKD